MFLATYIKMIYKVSLEAAINLQQGKSNENMIATSSYKTYSRTP